jgi:iron complex outermembrane receptor protein
VTNSRFFQETISAAYVRGDLKFLDNRLWLVGGVRFEKTEDIGEGPRDDVRAIYRQDAQATCCAMPPAGSSPSRPTPSRPPACAIPSAAPRRPRDYSDFYPSVNGTFYLTDNLVLRAAYAKTLGRPALSEIIPGLTVSDPASAVRTATIVNTGLQPWSADNFDVSFEVYNLKGAVVSLSLFRKDIKNFFLQVRSPATLALLEEFGLSDDYLDYEVITKTNGGEASVEGYELSWRQNLHFLPTWAKGFSTFANATIAKRSGPNAEDFTNFAHKNLNWGLTYSRRSFTFRYNVAYAYKVPGVLVAASATVPAGTRTYVAPQITQDWSFDWRFAKRFTVYGSARNFNGANKRTERTGPGAPDWTRPQSYQNFGTMVTLGLRTQF